MKWLLVLLVLLFGVWLWRRGRATHAPAPPKARPGPAQAIVACTRCGVHVPQASAVTGRHGVYCCAAHRQEAEGG